MRTGRPVIRPRVVSTTALTMVLLGGLLAGALVLGAVTSASASGESISVTPHALLTAAKSVVVKGSGFVRGANGAILECNVAPGQPATVISIHGVTHAIAVGCTDPVPAKTTKMGTLSSTRLPVVIGTLGSWETGTDSAGNPAAADSASYPCPPTSSQEALGISCAFQFLDNKAQLVTRSVSFKVPTTTTTTTVPTTTTTTLPLGCDPAPQSATNGTVTVIADPGTCLSAGSVVTIRGTGFAPATPATIAECNSAPGQPTVVDSGNTVPVGCTDIFSHPVITGSDGSLPPTAFTVITGTVGPPAQGTDSAGTDAATDAANYPCPPTPAQVAVGDTCGFVVAAHPSDLDVVPISFRS